MTLEEFENEARQMLESILNRLQTVNLLTNRSVPEAQSEILQIGQQVVALSHLIEDFIAERRSSRE